MDRADSAVSSPSGDLPREVWVLGFVSLLMDVSSEMIHSLLPVFMVSVLGAGASAVGLVEGAAEAVALCVKVFSGTLSDYLGKRKGLALAGYGLAAASKPAFALAGRIRWVLAARFADRIGKGIRGAPRDALIADLTPAHARGAAYGLRESLDTVGAVLGPALGITLMLAWKGDFRAVFWAASVPALLSASLLALGVSEPHRPGQSQVRSPLSRAALARLGPGYWKLVAVGAIFSLARFSEAFLILRARQLGLGNDWAPTVYILMNVVYASSVYPVGRLGDRMDRSVLLALGLAVLLLADLALAHAPGLALAAAGVALWGLHLGLSQGLLAAMVADSAPAELRGTAFGLFNLAGGAAALCSSLLAGLLWERWGAPAAFHAGAAFAVLAAALLGAPLKGEA